MTHAAGTAAAHIGYIGRIGAKAEMVAERMPENVKEAQAWLNQVEATERKNGRVIDKVMVALPLELSAEQQTQLVRDFMSEVTQGRASWLAAIHRDDAGNPHAHIVIRDKDPETGKRVAMLSEKGSTEALRLAWEQAANAALLSKGVQIDRRSLKAQGIDQDAQIHVGPKAKAMEEKGVRPESKIRKDHRGRDVRYPEIDWRHAWDGDGTKSRGEKNAEIIGINEHRRARQREQDLLVREMVQERNRKAQEARRAAAAAKEAEEAKQAQAVREIAAAVRYAGLVRDAATAKEAAGGAEWQIMNWTTKHPMRARLHRLGLVKAGPLVEIEGRMAADKKAQAALGADPEGKRAYEAREAARKAREAQKREAERELRRVAQEQRKAAYLEQQRQKGPDRGKGRDGPGFSR
jgi:hypothetical protein